MKSRAVRAPCNLARVLKSTQVARQEGRKLDSAPYDRVYMLLVMTTYLVQERHWHDLLGTTDNREARPLQLKSPLQERNDVSDGEQRTAVREDVHSARVPSRLPV
jgi:hypothetical protein